MERLTLDQQRYFNPRSRVGSDVTFKDIDQCHGKISIHAPA